MDAVGFVYPMAPGAAARRVSATEASRLDLANGDPDPGAENRAIMRLGGRYTRGPVRVDADIRAIEEVSTPDSIAFLTALVEHNAAVAGRRGRDRHLSGIPLARDL